MNNNNNVSKKRKKTHSYRTDNNNNNNNDVNNSSSSNCTDDGAGAGAVDNNDINININNNNNNSKKKNNNEGDDITTVTGVTEAEVAARAKAVFALVMAKARLDEAKKKEKTLVMAKARLDEAKKKAEKKKIKEEAATEKKKIKAEKKKIKEEAATEKKKIKAEKKKIKEEAATETEKKKIKAEKKKIKEEAATETEKKKIKAEKKKIRATGKRAAAITAKKMKEAANQKLPLGQEKWVDELGNPSPIYEYTTEEVRLINIKFSPNNPDEKKQYNSTKVFTRNNPMDLSLKKEQEPNLAWVKDKNMISKLQQHEQDQQEQPDSPQYINIPVDGLHPAVCMAGTLRIGVKLLKLKSVNDKELMVLFCQAIDLLFTVRITHKLFWNAMLSDTDSYGRDQAEGFYTWKGRFNNKFFCTVFLKILKSLHLTEKDIDDLLKVLPPGMRSIAHLCQLSYNYMGLLDLWICEKNDPHCAFGVIGNKGSILYTDYDTFQNNRLLRLKGITIDANNTRELLQGAVNQVLVGGNFITTGWEESKPISFGPMLVTVSASEKGAIQLRDVVLEANGFAKVLDKCTLKEKLKDELSRLEYSGDANQHVRNFIRGLFGRSGMMLFGCGNAWKFEFDTNFPSTLNLKHKGNEIIPVTVTGCGKTIKKE